jgi:hypothetical protein
VPGRQGVDVPPQDPLEDRRRPGVRGRDGGHREEVHLLRHEQATRLERPQQPCEHGAGLGEPREQQPHVDEVEPLPGQVVGEDVVHPGLEVRVRPLPQDREVEVGRHDGAVGRHPLRQPRGDRPAPGPHLQAAPARPDAARLELADGPRVERRLERLEPLALDLPRVGERVRRLLRPPASAHACSHGA